MFRKLTFALVASAALGAAALAPTSASAWGYGFHGGYDFHGFHRGFDYGWGYGGYDRDRWCYFHPGACDSGN